MKLAIDNLKSNIGFTLVELLVVVTIIVVLLALLTPALDKAIVQAAIARCMANQKAIGAAMVFYQTDHKRSYPIIADWAGLLGQRGNYGSNLFGAQTESDQRPLNRYLGYTGRGARVPVAQCPSDLGDPYPREAGAAEVRNTYTSFGTSYYPQVYDNNNYRVQRVVGVLPAASRTVAEETPWRQSRIERTSNKLIVADWPWRGDRSYDDPQSRWHNDDPQDRRYNALFADSHVEFFFFERNEMEAAYPNSTRPPDPTWRWW